MKMLWRAVLAGGLAAMYGPVYRSPVYLSPDYRSHDGDLPSAL